MARDGPAEFSNWHPIYNCEVYIVGESERESFSLLHQRGRFLDDVNRCVGGGGGVQIL